MSNGRKSSILLAFILFGLAYWWFARPGDRVPVDGAKRSDAALPSARSGSPAEPLAPSSVAGATALPSAAQTPAPPPAVEPEAESPTGPRYALRFLRTEDRKPVEGAALMVRGNVLMYDYAQGRATLPERVPIGKTDAEGFIAFPAFRVRSSESIIVDADGRAIIALNVAPRAPDADSTTTVVYLPPPVRIAGIVVDENDAPVPGAIVGDPILGILAAASDAQWGSVEYSIFGLDYAIADAEGRFVIEGAPQAKALTLFAHAKGRLRSDGVRVADFAKEVKLVLPGGERTLSGLVQFADGRPDPGARVTLSTSKDSPEAARLHQPGTLRVVTEADASGRFAIAGIPGGFIECVAMSNWDSRYYVSRSIEDSDDLAKVVLT